MRAFVSRVGAYLGMESAVGLTTLSGGKVLCPPIDALSFIRLGSSAMLMSMSTTGHGYHKVVSPVHQHQTCLLPNHFSLTVRAFYISSCGSFWFLQPTTSLASEICVEDKQNPGLWQAEMTPDPSLVSKHGQVLVSERQVGFWKHEGAGNGLGDGLAPVVSQGPPAAFGHGHSDISGMGSPSRSEMLLSTSADYAKGLRNQHPGAPQEWSRRSPPSSKLVEQWSGGGDGRAGLSAFSWSNPNMMLLVRGKSAMSFPHLNGIMDNLDAYEANHRTEFSGSFHAQFQTKLRFNADGLSLDTAASHMSGDLDLDEPFGSLEELQSHVIGNLLPDDEEELLAGVVDDFDCMLPPSNGEESEDVDLFISGGGMELEGDAQDALGVYINSHRTLEVLTGCPTTHGSNGPGSVAGEHPYGEHPSRTLFVRNINSNVEDTELRALFEQYGAIRTLYTACKHRGFVMISYYDIRAARSAMRALQNKPLRRRKLDIHFSIPKDNPSDKDVNQGTLVVFNLDASVSNDDLRQIFGEYGEVKEIRETPHKRHHKFIEFYDVRAAEAALRALNRSDIAGKRIKLEPSRPGGARRSLMQQLSQELEQEESRPHRQQAHSPLGNSPPGHSQWGSVGSAPVENGPLRNLHHSLTHVNYASLTSKPVNGVAGSLPPHITPPVRVGTIGSHVGQGAQLDASHSLGHSGLGAQRLPLHHNSLPEFTNSPMKSVHYNPSPGSVSTPTVRIREGVDGSRLQRTSSGGLNENSSFQHASVIGVVGNAPLLYQSSSSSGSALSGHQFLWGNSSQFHQHSQSSPPVTWSTSSVSNSFNSQGHPLSHAYTGTHGHLVNAVLSSHLPRVGSAPAPGEPSILERRHTYLGESPETSSLVRAGSLGAMGLGSNGTSAINICSGHGLMSMGAGLGGTGGLEHGSPNLGVASPQHRGRVFASSGVPGSVPSMMESFNDRSRSRRVDSAFGQVDNKKQYQLDLDRILRGEDNRTTLMIKNIPNKYTSKMLLAAIDEHHRGTYDFIYLPIDFKNKCNVGYAFINMIAPSRIVPFYQAFNGKKWEKFNSEKVASLAYARIQGKAALVAHFQNSSLMNEDKRCRPILFHSEGPHIGDQEPFPVGVNVRIRPSRERSSSGGSHQGSPSTSSSSRDDSVPGCAVGMTIRNFSPDRDQD